MVGLTIARFFDGMNQNRFIKILKMSLLTVVFVFCACSHPHDAPLAPQAVTHPNPDNLNGLIDQTLRENFESAWIDPCDEKYKSKEIEIVKALNSHSAEISAYLRQPAADLENIQIGPMFFYKPKEVGTGKDQWLEYETSWDKIIEFYKSLNDQSTITDWATLKTRVRDILNSDHNRLVDGVNVELTKDSGPVLAEAIKSAHDCRGIPNCVTPQFSSQTQAFLESNFIYFTLKKAMSRQDSLNEKRDSLDRLLGRLEIDYFGTYAFKVSGVVFRKSKSEFEISLDAGDFKGYENQVAGIISSVWTSKDYRITVNWKKPSENRFAYKLVFGNEPGARGYTNLILRTIVFNPVIGTTSIAHELGHALGFPDRYYNVWKKQNCTYVMQYNTGDIMSDDETGNVVPSSWAELNKNFPLY